MNPLVSQILAMSILAMAAFPGHAAPGVGDPLAIYRSKARVLVVIAVSASDDRLIRQRDIFARIKPGADERDLALAEAHRLHADATGRNAESIS